MINNVKDVEVDVLGIKAQSQVPTSCRFGVKCEKLPLPEY
jgi:hypothetical protein